jgi:hypothetical protein
MAESPRASGVARFNLVPQQRASTFSVSVLGEFHHDVSTIDLPEQYQLPALH